MAQVLQPLNQPERSPDLLVGTETRDDAGVYRLAPGLALVQTVDFFPPIVDDPFQFGQIAASNALSDVFAMNGDPLTALNIAAFPDDRLPLSILGEIIAGAADRVQAAGATTVGGHTIRDSEIKFGLSVTGIVNPDTMMTNATARPGDFLVLTKALGTGFVATAAKRRECPPEVLEAAVTSMIQLNAVARDAVRAIGGAHAMTDVTGYGLAGHGSEIAEGSGLTIELQASRFPILHGAEAFAIPRYFTRASKTNRAFLESQLQIEPGIDPRRLEFAFDPQTSGGLLVALPEDSAVRLVNSLASSSSGAASIVGKILPRESEVALRIGP